MANESDVGEPPAVATVRKKRVRVSVVWIIPVLAALVALGIAVQRLRNEGPTIVITVNKASGIEAGKTFIKYKDVTIGQVTKVQLSPDFSRVLVTAQIAKYAEGLMVEDAKFWLVEPRITLSGISGLNTLLSGQFIGFQSGKSQTRSRRFVALEVAPIIKEQAGRRLRLSMSSLGSLGVGAPVYYRSLPVGEIEAYKFAPNGKSIEATIFVDAPYDNYITSTTRFWNASGIDVVVGANGVEIHTESLISVLVGGVAFDAPEFLPPGNAVAENAEFPLYQSRVIAMTQPDPVERRIVLYFNESLRGLSVGAPVTLFGLPVGQVSEVGLAYDPATLTLRPRVLITFYPERLEAKLSSKQTDPNEDPLTRRAQRARLLRHLVEDRGLRAQLQTGSLITGEMYVAFDYVANAPKPKVDWSQDPVELPVVSGGLASIETKLDSILTKVDRMPLGAMGASANDLLTTLNQTLKSADSLLKNIDARWVPEGEKTIADLHRTLADVDRTLLAKDSPTSQDLHDMMQELTDTARSLRVFLQYLEQHPSMLIRGKREEKK
jgi:paraquat-inducible protein B